VIPATDAPTERRPWMLDARRYPVMTGRNADGVPVVVPLLRREFPARVVRSKHITQMKWGLSDGWRCFVSGVQCHWAPPDAYEGPGVADVPWALSLEHLVPLHLCRVRGWSGDLLRAASSLSNQAVLGRRLNQKVGHNPLPLKFLARQTLASHGHDRDAPDGATFRDVMGRLIAMEDGLRLHGLYPWQPWTYGVSAHRRAADAFMSGMEAYEREFLAVPRHERAAFIEGFHWRW